MNTLQTLKQKETILMIMRDNYKQVLSQIEKDLLDLREKMVSEELR